MPRFWRPRYYRRRLRRPYFYRRRTNYRRRYGYRKAYGRKVSSIKATPEVILKKKELFWEVDIWQAGMDSEWSQVNDYMKKVISMYRGFSKIGQGLYSNYEKVMLKKQMLKVSDVRLTEFSLYTRKQKVTECCGTDGCDICREPLMCFVKDHIKHGGGNYVGSFNPWEVVLDVVTRNPDDSQYVNCGLTTASSGVIGYAMDAQENVKRHRLRRTFKKYWKIYPKCKNTVKFDKDFDILKCNPCDSYKNTKMLSMKNCILIFV